MPSSKPPITSTQHELPFSQLGWEQFERLCLRLVLAEGYVRAEHLGASGGEGGRDIVAWRDRQRVVFQCKRVKQFVAHDGIKEVNKLRSRPPQDQPDEIVFIIACPVSDQTRKGIRQAWGDEKTCLFWAGSELDSKVKKQEAILREFFGLSASAVSNIPFILPTADPGDFQGRKSELAHLVARLVPKKPAGSLRIVLVSGSAGVGKSVLVSRFANQYRNRFPGGVVGIRVNRGDAYSLAGELARSFGYPLDPDDDRPAHARVQELFACREALLILDNAEEAAIVRELLPSGGPCAVVIITQDRGLATALGLAEGATQHLRPLTKGEALALLEAILGDTRLACDRMNVDRLLMLTGCLPLAIRIVGATLREQSGRPLKSYVTSLEDSRLRLTRLRVHGDEELDVRASLFLSLDALDEASTFFFACASICGESGFALSVAGAAAAYDEDESWRCAGRLRRFSLLEVSPDGEERFMFHPLVRLFAREVAEVRGLLTHARERHARFLIDTVRDLPEKAWETKLVGDVEDILLAAEWLVESGQLDVDFGMRVGNLLDYLGRWKQAAFLAEQHAVLAKVHGNEDAATRFCIRHSKQLLHLGQVDAALERLVVLGEEPLKPIIKAVQLNTLGGALRKKGRTDEAIEAFQESLAIRRELNNRPGIGMILNSLGGALRKKGRTDEAIEAFQKSLAIGRELNNRPHVAMTLNSLGGALRKKGRTDEAIEAFQESLTIGRQLDDRPHVAMTLNSLGGALRKKGLIDEAIEAFQESLTIGRQLDDRPHVAMTLNSLGGALRKKGLIDEAIEAFQESLTIGRQLDDRPHVAMTLNSLGGALRRKGLIDEAIEAFQESLTIGRQLDDRPHVAMTLNSLGGALRKKGLIDEAIEAFQESLTIGRQLDDRPHVAMTLNSLGGALRRKGLIDEAIEAFQESLTIGRQLDDRPHVAMILNSFGNVFLQIGYVEIAIDALMESLSLEEKLENKRGLNISARSLVRALKQLGAQECARKTCVKALEIAPEQEDLVQLLGQLSGGRRGSGIWGS